MNTWPIINKHQLSSDLVNLPTIEAQEWVRVGDGHVRPRLEGTAFDRYGNLYYCFRFHPGSAIYRVSEKKEITTVYSEENSCFIGIAIHKDGRIFAADIDYHRIVVLSPDGVVERDLLAHFPDKSFDPNDLCFNKRGDLFFTDFKGTALNPTGGIYRLNASENYQILHSVVLGLSAPNGIAFTPDERNLWVSETASNRTFKIRVDGDGNMMKFPFAQTSFYYATGYEMFDSLKVDECDNCYVGVMYGGRILVLNSNGVPIGNVFIAGRENGESMMSPNLAIKPGTNEGYVVSSGENGAWIYSFPTIAKANTLFSDL